VHHARQRGGDSASTIFRRPPTRQKRATSSVNETLTTQIAGFVQSVVDAMGVALTTEVEESADGTRINLNGENGGALVRRGGEGLQALQHVVATAFRRQLGDDNRIVIDCNGFRRDKDAELKQMARYIAEKARSTGIAQEMGPLNPYERRIVHLAIAEDTDVSSESIGDAFMKTVIISSKK
jgi:spoIIIJ-associated protein